MTVVVVSQPMFFPWVGLFEQIRLADVYVHYDDVQFPQGRSFTNRVQVKTAHGIKWLTVPVVRDGLALISETRIDDGQRWREKHLGLLKHSYARAPFAAEMLALVEEIYALETSSLSELNIAALERVSAYFGFTPRFELSSRHGTTTHGTEKLLELMQRVGGDVYVTGHGARNYFDHELFERHGMAVRYMEYRKTPYPQLHGEFTPYVSILDLIANAGREGRSYIASESVDWKEFING